MRSSANKIQLTGFDDLFQAGGEAETSGEREQERPGDYCSHRDAFLFLRTF